MLIYQISYGFHGQGDGEGQSHQRSNFVCQKMYERWAISSSQGPRGSLNRVQRKTGTHKARTHDGMIMINDAINNNRLKEEFQ